MVFLGLIFFIAPLNAEEIEGKPVDEGRCESCRCSDAATEEEDRSTTMQRNRAEMDRLLNMSSEELSRVRQLIERLERMDEEEREGLRRRANMYHQISEERRRSLQERWENMPPEEKERIHRQVKEREEKWKAMSPEEREQARNQKGRRE